MYPARGASRRPHIIVVARGKQHKTHMVYYTHSSPLSLSATFVHFNPPQSVSAKSFYILFSCGRSFFSRTNVLNVAHLNPHTQHKNVLFFFFSKTQLDFWMCERNWLSSFEREYTYWSLITICMPYMHAPTHLWPRSIQSMCIGAEMKLTAYFILLICANQTNNTPFDFSYIFLK